MLADAEARRDDDISNDAHISVDLSTLTTDDDMLTTFQDCEDFCLVLIMLT